MSERSPPVNARAGSVTSQFEDFVLEKIPAVEKPGKPPPFLRPIEVGSFFVAVTVPGR